jgi:hypothetical protein
MTALAAAPAWTAADAPAARDAQQPPTQPPDPTVPGEKSAPPPQAPEPSPVPPRDPKGAVGEGRVNVSLATFDTHNSRNLRQETGNAIATASTPLPPSRR